MPAIIAGIKFFRFPARQRPVRPPDGQLELARRFFFDEYGALYQ